MLNGAQFGVERQDVKTESFSRRTLMLLTTEQTRNIVNYKYQEMRNKYSEKYYNLYCEIHL